MESRFEIHVDNIGTVYRGEDHAEACRTFHSYVRKIREGGTRAGFGVMFFENEQLLTEFWLESDPPEFLEEFGSLLNAVR